MKKLHSDARKIIETAIQASLPDEAVRKAICGKNFSFLGRIIVIAIGKAAWNMAKAAAEHIPHPIDCGIVLTKYGHSRGEISGFSIYEAGHPLPDENTILGTEKVIEAVSGLSEKDTVFFLVSGGFSKKKQTDTMPRRCLRPSVCLFSNLCRCISLPQRQSPDRCTMPPM